MMMIYVYFYDLLLLSTRSVRFGEEKETATNTNTRTHHVTCLDDFLHDDIKYSLIMTLSLF